MGSDINDALERISKTNEAQMVQQMFAMMTDKCFLKCIEKPGSQLSRSDKSCLENCMERYLDVTKICGEAVASRSHSHDSSDW
ncbi:Mitochondrial import inner membrane translocase subunit [Plasmodiophora brassicae]